MTNFILSPRFDLFMLIMSLISFGANIVLLNAWGWAALDALFALFWLNAWLKNPKRERKVDAPRG